MFLFQRALDQDRLGAGQRDVAGALGRVEAAQVDPVIGHRARGGFELSGQQGGQRPRAAAALAHDGEVGGHRHGDVDAGEAFAAGGIVDADAGRGEFPALRQRSEGAGPVAAAPFEGHERRRQIAEDRRHGLMDRAQAQGDRQGQNGEGEAAAGRHQGTGLHRHRRAVVPAPERHRHDDGRQQDDERR